MDMLCELAALPARVPVPPLRPGAAEAEAAGLQGSSWWDGSGKAQLM